MMLNCLSSLKNFYVAKSYFNDGCKGLQHLVDDGTLKTAMEVGENN